MGRRTQVKKFKVSKLSNEDLIEELIATTNQLNAPTLGDPELIKEFHILPAEKRFESAKKELLRRLGKVKK